jgi:hypothetical protein
MLRYSHKPVDIDNLISASLSTCGPHIAYQAPFQSSYATAKEASVYFLGDDGQQSVNKMQVDLLINS